MLDTLLHIGRTLRETGNPKHHKYVVPAPEGREIEYWNIPVNKDFEIDFDSKENLINENTRQNLFYLAFKASETSPENKYLFGDIFYGGGKEVGYYRLKNPTKKDFWGQSSFYRTEKDTENLKGSTIEKFRDSLQSQIEKIESFLEERGKEKLIWLHFNFDEKHWYQLEDELDLVNKKLLERFIEQQGEFYVLSNFLYKTLIQSPSHIPDFIKKNNYKNKAFADVNEVMDLVFALSYSKTALIKKGKVKIIVLPKGENLAAEDIESFFGKARDAGDEEAEEIKLNLANQVEENEQDEWEESLIDPLLAKAGKTITQYDFVFSKTMGKKDVDLLEVSGIERSFLVHLNERIRKIKQSPHLYQNRKYDISQSFFYILGDKSKEKIKYQNHLFKVLPQIYSGSYYRDDVLLPAFIEKVEYNIRNDSSNYNLLKYDYYFLVLIRNNNGEKDMVDMKTSKSYEAGLLLGKMAKAIGRGREPKIKSFEKNYVGLLSRRISDKQGLIDFANFINEKLAIHNVAYPELKQASVKLAQMVDEINEKEYRKNYCAFGFFESYYGFHKETEDTEQNPTTENQ